MPDGNATEVSRPQKLHYRSNRTSLDQRHVVGGGGLPGKSLKALIEMSRPYRSVLGFRASVFDLRYYHYAYHFPRSF